MRTVFAAVSALAVVAVVVPAPAFAVSGRKACSSSYKGARTIVATSRVRVVRVPRTGEFFACTRRRPAAFLGADRRGAYCGERCVIRNVRIAGYWVGWSVTETDRERYTVANACNLRTRAAYRSGLGQDPENSEDDHDIRGLGLTSSGALAWVITDPSVGPSANTVYVADAAGGRVVADGAGVDPGSLAVGRGVAYWTELGQPKRVALRGSAASSRKGENVQRC
jgi:hypothetical protein